MIPIDQEAPAILCTVAPTTPKEPEPEPIFMQKLEEGVPPKIRFQRKKPVVADLNEIQESPLFSGGEG
jgi:hypothetical protein